MRRIILAALVGSLLIATNALALRRVEQHTLRAASALNDSSSFTSGSVYTLGASEVIFHIYSTDPAVALDKVDSLSAAAIQVSSDDANWASLAWGTTTSLWGGIVVHNPGSTLVNVAATLRQASLYGGPIRSIRPTSTTVALSRIIPVPYMRFTCTVTSWPGQVNSMTLAVICYVIYDSANQ